MRIGWLLLGLMVAGCETAPEPPTGKQLFAQNCVGCHGTDGKGGGWISDSLTVKPADLTRISARNGGTFPLADVLSAIDGFHRKSLPQSTMPEWGYIFDGPLDQVDTGDGVITPVPQPLIALARYLESIQGS
ncbi:cytochrome c [Litoreibacter sp.]|nr:cytochrome c [Litoreibacter sp.]